MQFLVLAAAGFAGIALACVAAWLNHRRLRSSLMSRRWHLTYRWSWAAGRVLGTGSYFISYPSHHQEQTYQIMGFPFFAAAFDPAGVDFVGPLTVPAIIGNFLFFVLLPQVLLLAVPGSWSKRVA